MANGGVRDAVDTTKTAASEQASRYVYREGHEDRVEEEPISPCTVTSLRSFRDVICAPRAAPLSAARLSRRR
jgi:hypothetical protein